MILQALKDYYDRKTADPESGIAPPGWERKEMPFLIVLDAQGKCTGIEDTREMRGKKLVGKAFLVPQSVKRTSGVAANLLWDNLEYIAGIPLKDVSKKERVAQAHDAFVNRAKEYAGSQEIDAVISFLESPDIARQLQQCENWQEVSESGLFASFKIAGRTEPVFRGEAFRQRYEATVAQGAGEMGMCLVSGKEDMIATLHPSVKGISGANPTGANIVSFNFPAACSFGKEQGGNAPVGSRAVFAYTTALNTLTGKDSRQKLTLGDATMLFWADRDTELEDNLADIFDDRGKKDDPDALTGAVVQLLASVKTGAYHNDNGKTRFFVLGLAPNAARLSVRFWHQGTVEEMAGRFAEWFEDLMIVHGENQKEHLSMFRLLCSIAPLGKAENIPPNLAGNVMRSILEGVPLPETLLTSALGRERLDHPDKSPDWQFIGRQYARMKLIKACLNRKQRFQKKNERLLTMSLDKNNDNIGYRLGRLFAVLERAQERVNPGINATIRDKYYASASSTPAAVFGTLMRMKNHHLAKLENAGEKVNLEKLIGEIFEAIPAKLPAHLGVDDQGAFAVGYYHQRQDFFVKKDNPAQMGTNEAI